MLHLLVDTCVWLDAAKDYRHQPTLHAIEQMIEVGAVNLVVPRQTVDELARNKERIVRDTGKSLSSTFKRVKEAVRQFGQDKGKLNALASLDDVDHRITILGEAVNESVRKIEAIFGRAEIIDTSEPVLLRAARRALQRKAPFHREKNGIGDAILIEINRDVLLRRPPDATCAFVTHNNTTSQTWPAMNASHIRI